MNRSNFFIVLCLSLLLASCHASAKQNDDRIHVTILHLNDVYEITPVSGGKEGGLARVATLYKQLKKKNPNTIMTHGGDLFSPSAMGTAKVGGKRLAGKQMVNVLNSIGLQYATFGNHEFDIKKEEFYDRMQETRFAWISGNVFDEYGKPYSGVQPDLILTFPGKVKGDEFKLGIFGVSLTVNRPDFVSYTDPMKTAEKEVSKLDKASDFVIALTHLAIDEDERLLQQLPAIDLLLGAHEHVNYQRWRGNNLTPLLKGDANARTVYVVDIFHDPKTKKTAVKPSLVKIDETIVEDTEVKATVDKWVKIAFDAFRNDGFNPEEVVTTTTKNLDGLEANVRSKQTNLTELVARSLLLPYPEAELSIYNSGSIRIDDMLPVGQITVYDVIRVLPFVGSVQLVEMKGSLLKKMLDQGEANIGSGGYLQSANTSKPPGGRWMINDALLNEQQTYKVAISDYLTAGKEQNMGFLNPSNPDMKIVKDGQGIDIRQLVIQELRGK